MSFRSKCQKIHARDWVDIRDAWLNHLPDITDLASPPPSSLAQIISLSGKVDILSDQQVVLSDIAGVRETALWESVFLLHKGGHIMRASQKASNAGMRSWAVFTGYHSAYLSAKSILGFLGVALPQPSGQQLLMELFPNTVISVSSKKKRGQKLDDASYLAYKLGRLDQNHLWQFFQRIIEVSSVNVWDVSIIENIKSFGWEQYSKRRNPFIYNSVFWPFDDLTANVIDIDFCAPPDGFPNTFDHIDTEDPEFLVKASFLIFNLGFTLLSDIASMAPVFEQEMAAFQLPDWTADNAQYHRFFPV